MPNLSPKQAKSALDAFLRVKAAYAVSKRTKIDAKALNECLRNYGVNRAIRAMIMAELTKTQRTGALTALCSEIGAKPATVKLWETKLGYIPEKWVGAIVIAGKQKGVPIRREDLRPDLQWG